MNKVERFVQDCAFSQQHCIVYLNTVTKVDVMISVLSTIEKNYLVRSGLRVPVIPGHLAFVTLIRARRAVLTFGPWGVVVLLYPSHPRNQV